MSIRVGLAGLGFMGSMHFTGLRRIEGVEVAAVCDVDPRRLRTDWTGSAGNIDRGQRLDLAGVRTFGSLKELLAGCEVDVVDICAPTFQHAPLSLEALRAGKHVFCEKPMALTSRDACQVEREAAKAGKLLMIGHVLRFHPQYHMMKEMIDSQRFGRLLWAKFFRSGGAPIWSWDGWMTDAARSGAAALDLHIHDTDTVLWFFGMPRAVTSHGPVGPDGGVNYIFTEYHCDNGARIFGEGGWLAGPYPFSMGATLAFESAAVEYHSAKSPALTVYPHKGQPEHPTIPEAEGYVDELRYFIDCLRQGRPIDRVPPKSSAQSVAIVEAEIASVRAGKTVSLT